MEGISENRLFFDKIKNIGTVPFSLFLNIFPRQLITATKRKKWQIWASLTPWPLMLPLPVPLRLCSSGLCPESIHLPFHVSDRSKYMMWKHHSVTFP